MSESPTKSTTKQIPDCFAANLVLGRFLELMLSSSTQGTLRGMFFRVEPGDPRTTFTAVLGNASHSALIV